MIDFCPFDTEFWNSFQKLLVETILIDIMRPTSRAEAEKMRSSGSLFTN
ncbi:MAG: hypothetical protein HLUCCO02_12515 [Idiomarinaceae bacterium HL-53]|nr:MAG: hypothetical protein HLUCCO02_12515 [Idiomarinaceae bacterium HL-53]